MKKILVCIQMSPYDSKEAKELLRLITDLESGNSEHCDILISYRFDVPRDSEIESYVSKRFIVHAHVTRRKTDGWPGGCNAQLSDTYGLFIENTRSGRWKYDYVLFLEGDDVPLRRGWIEEIHKEAYESGKLVIGPWLKKGDCGSEHINGNCVIHKDFFRRCKRIMNPPSNQGWDWFIRQDMMQHGHPSKLIFSDYRLGTTDNPWRGDEYLWEAKRYRDPANALYGKDLFPCILHGCKGMQAIEAVRKKLLTSRLNDTCSQ